MLKIFLITENKEELKKRLIKRNQNSTEEVAKSCFFEEDVKHWKDYDYIVINKNLEVCFYQIEKLLIVISKIFLFFSYNSAIL